MNDKQIEERNEIFDSAVREKMTGYEPQVPHALWNRISSELDMGEASEESTPMAEHHEVKYIGWWKMAIAAAVVLTLTVGTLLYTMNSPTGVSINTAPVASSTKASQPTAAPVQVTQTKMVAQGKTQEKKKLKATVTAAQADQKAELITATATEPAIENTTVKSDAVTQNQNTDLANAPVTTENRLMDVGNIPLASLNFLSTPSTVNDEITVIKSSEKKKKHGKKGDDESTKVILIGKKFESKPDIRYQIPVRF
jgi:hypothetical protein